MRFYFSFRSPFAAIAFCRLRRAVEFADVAIEPVPVWPDLLFGGHMDNPSDNLFKMAYIFHDAARQAELAGMDPAAFRALADRFTLPADADYRPRKLGVPVGPERWEVPHGAFLHAARHDCAWRFGEAIFLRRFGLDGGDAEDVMDPAVVERVAFEAGLDGDEAARAYAAPEIRDEIDACRRQSERDGVFGVPFFVLDRSGRRETFWGNDRLEHLLRAIEEGEQLPRIAPTGDAPVLASRR